MISGIPDNRVDLVKTICASGLTLVGLITGSGPFFTLLVSTSVNIGTNILANVADKAFEKWSSNWLDPDGIFDNNIRAALRVSLARSIRKLETEWRKTHEYNYLIYKKEHDRAQLSITLLHEFREDVNKLIQNDNFLSEASRNEYILTLYNENKISNDSIQNLLNITIDKYLGIVEPLAQFIKIHLIKNWVFFFNEFLKSDEGTSAWRSCQQLWQTSLFDGIVELRKSSYNIESNINQAQQDLTTVSTWLNQWVEELNTKHKKAFSGSIEKAFNDFVEQYINTINVNLDSLKINTERIANLLIENFNQLDFEKVMSNFLQKELLNDQYVNLKQAGHSTEFDDVYLAQVFVDLPTSSERKFEPPDESGSGNDFQLKPGIISEILNTAKGPLDPKSVRLKIDQTHEGLSLPSGNKEGRYVIIGGPGQGKTTIGQFLCQIYRTSILEKTLDVHYDKVRIALDQVKNLCDFEKIELPLIPRFPFRVILSDFAAKLASEQPINSLLSYIAERIQTRTNQQITVDHLRKWLTDYPWIIIFDGLDEVPVSSNRADILSAIDNFWIDVSGCNADVLVVATTRPQGFNNEFSPQYYHHKWLLPLSKARATHFAERLVKVRYSAEQDRQTRILDRLRSALDEDATAKLMRSPLQVAIMTALVDRIGKPPQERWSLFQKYYTVIYQRETERDIPAATILRNYEPDINAIHYRVGLILQIESEYSGRTGVHLSIDRFSALVNDRLVEEGHEGKELDDLTNKIIEAAIDRLVFLVGVETNEIGFEIRSLQEFMAAEALMGTSDLLLQKRLRFIAPIGNWRNVFLFAAGKCFALEDRQHLRDMIRGICVDLNESVNKNEEIFKLTLTGSQLALDLLEDGPAQRQPKYAKGITRLACRVWDLPPNKNQVRLAELYESKFEDVYFQELDNRLQRNNPYWSGAWNTLICLVEKNIGWAKTLSDKHWPKNNAGLLALLQIAEISEKYSWIVNNISFFLAKLSIYDLFNFVHPLKSYISNNNRQLQWLNILNPSAIITKLSLVLSDQTEIKEAFYFLSPINQNVDWSSIIIDFPKPKRDFLPIIAFARFLANPSKETLANEIFKIANNASVKSIKRAAYRMSWILKSLVLEIKSQDDLIKLSERIANGEYGDTKDWNSAEERWLTHGISMEDLEYMTDNHWPFDKNIGNVGVPLNLIHWTSGSRKRFSESSDVTKPINEIEEFFLLYKKIGPSKFRSKIASWVLWGITLDYLLHFPELNNSFNNIVDNNYNLPSFEDLQQLINDSNDNFFALELIALYDYQKIKSEDKITFFDYMGKNNYSNIVFSPKSSNKFLEKLDELSKELTEIFISHPKRLGVLKLLAVLAKNGHKHEIPYNLLDTDQYKKTSQCEAAIIVTLAQDNWHNIDVKRITKQIYDLTKNNSSFLSQVLETLMYNQSSPVEIFLPELLRNFPINEWKNRKQIIDTLNESVSNRPSHIIDIWSELGLPESLKKIVQISEPLEGSLKTKKLQ